MKTMLLSVAALALTVAMPASAGTVVSGFTGTGLPACDDCFSGAVSTGFNMNFFGTTYSNLHVSNNGYVTFGAGQGTFTPTGLGAAYVGRPIIAPFFGDVDTRAGLGSTQWATGTFAGRNAFGTTWDNTGYFSQQGNKRNTFQLILTDRSDTGTGNFDIYFNYDQIQWETGGASGGSNGLGGVSAAVGFNAGVGGAPGTFFEFAGSRVPGSFLDSGSNPLIRGSNINTPGRYLFSVRNGQVIGGVPEPSSWAMLIAGFGMVGAAARRRRLQAA